MAVHLAPVLVVGTAPVLVGSGALSIASLGFYIVGVLRMGFQVWSLALGTLPSRDRLIRSPASCSGGW